MKQLPFGPGRSINLVITRLSGYAEESVQRYWRQLRADPDNTKPTMLTKEYAGFEDGTISTAQIRRDAMGNIVAGTDTTAITATYALWLLSQHPHMEEALIQEVSTLPTDFMDEDLRPLKLLGNVLNETLRLRGAIMQGLPRIVPAGGAEFCGYHVPDRVIVGVQAYTMHTNPDVWAQPETFDPWRWDIPTKDMLHSFYPFGGGSRVCIGMHFAQLELRHALANFYRTFEGGVKISHAEGFSEADMVPMSYFLQPPKGKRCLLQRRK